MEQDNEKKLGVLVLTRRISEKILIGDDIEVVVMGISGNQVRIGVNAPRDIRVWREEVAIRIKKQNEVIYGA